MNKTSVALLVALLGLSQCKQKGPTPEEQLPPATQTGANTFGCLVNGQVWTPKGNNGSSNYTVSYDPAFRNGTLNVATYRYLGSGATDLQSMVLYSDSLKTTGRYALNKPGRQEGLFHDFQTGCEYSGHGRNYGRGVLTITRLDAQAGIISGTFAFTLYLPGYDSLRVTQGRFDKKL